MGLSHSPSIITDGLVLHLDGGNYKSFQSSTKNLITTNSLPSSTTGYAASGGNGTVTYDSINQAVVWERTSYEVWGAVFQNSTLFNKTLDTSKQYTASFEWKIDNAQIGAGAYIFEIADGPDLYNVTGVAILGSSTSIGNGWYRFSHTFTPLNSGVGANFRILMGTYGTNVSRFSWRKLQLEQSSVRTDYVDGVPLSTWYDLSGNGNNGTIVGNIRYNASTQSLRLPGTVGSYIDVPSPNLISSNYTVMVASRYTTVTSGRILSAYINNWLLGHHSSTSEEYYAEGWVRDSAVADTSWRIYAGTGNISADQYSLYINGSLIVNNSNAGSQGPNGFTVGRFRGTDSEYSEGEIGFLLAYNRVLTASEIATNYNALKSRYGL
jgi:hypothetical protein